MFIIPYPQKMEIKEEKIALESLALKADNSEIEKFAGFLAEKDGKTALLFEKDSSLAEENYKIIIDENGIKVLYGELVGAYRATSSLKQIVNQKEDGKINCLYIEDYPSMNNRGYMLDISRGKIASLSYLKKLVDILSDLKYNQLQLYMETFVYEYKNFPEYYKDTQPLTKAEIMELDKYCKEHFMELVPNQNGFGHMASWTKKPELSHLAITGKDGKPSATLNPLLPETIEFIDKIYDGFFDAFSSGQVNIGMDEPFELGLNETKEACEKYGEGKIYTDYLNKICKLIYEKYGKTPMFWDDIIFKHPEQLDNIPKNSVLMQWGYETEQKFERNCRLIKEKGLKFYVCPGTSMWGSFTGRTNNTYFNITNAVESGCEYGAEGFLLTEWGDGGHPQTPATTYLPLTLGSVCWNRSSAGLDKRYELLTHIKAYLDKFIYKTTSEKSLADIVYHMGNYYPLEDGIHFNGSELWANKTKALSEIPALKKEGFKRIIKYMEALREELNEVTADENMLKEIYLSCEMVIFFAKVTSGESSGAKELGEKVKKEFEELWMLKNHSVGVDIFLGVIDKAMENI